MKRILLSLITILGVSAAIAGSTRAYFSDTETSTGNTFTTASFDLELGSDESIPFNATNVAPGDTGTGKITLTNSSSIDGVLDVKLGNLIESENGLNGPELAAGDYENGGDLWISFDVTGYVDVNQNGIFDSGDVQITYNGQKKSYPGFWSGDFHWHGIRSNLSAWNDVMTLTPGQSVDVVLSWRVDPDWDYSNYNQNIIQTDSLSFDIETSLNQVESTT